VPTRLLFPEKQKVVLEDFEPASPGEGEMLVRTAFSQMSIGTENTIFNAAYESGSHWANFAAFPFVPGYTVVGHVEQTGPGVTRFSVGDRVMGRASHASHAVVKAERMFPVPAAVPDTLVPWGKLAQIAFTAVRKAGIGLGESVLVIGAGPIGQMALRWAAAAGARHVVVCDPVPQRQDLAKAGGATRVIGASVESADEEVLDACGGLLPSTVIDTTGVAAVLPHALRLTRTLGRTVLLGDTGSPTQQHLTRDVLTRSLSLIGVHHSSGLWEEGETYALFFDLVDRGRFDMTDMNTHTFTPGQCVQAYRLANTARDTAMGVLFDWRQEA